MNLKTIGVVGAGQMGNGIAQVAAEAGYSVIMMDVNSVSLEKGIGNIKKILAKNVEKGKIIESEMKAVLQRIKPTLSLEDLNEADFIIEAASENIELKLNLFRELDKISRPDVILASNTSSISITKIASQTHKSDKVIGMHFMNPVPVMKLVEIISGLQTSQETLDVTLLLAEKMNKTTCISKDIPGFIANRILMPYINEAIQAFYEGVGSVEAIDTTMKLGTNVPMGPLTLADFIGLDTCLAIMNVLFDGFKDSKYRPSPLLVKYVEAGWLGRKTKKGFYTYE